MMKTILRTIAIVAGFLLMLLFGAAAVSLLMNQQQPTASATPDELNDQQLAQLGEYLHLQSELGEAVWPGFGEPLIPAVLYNEETVFLAGLADPAAGWQPMPNGRVHGDAWELLPVTTTGGRPVYRQSLPPDGQTPQAFTVRVGDDWAASMTTLEWTRIAMTEQLRSELPPFLVDLFPYPLFLDQLVSGVDQYETLLIHEAFHAFQGEAVPERLAAAEASLAAEGGYPWDDPDVEAAWQVELDLLAEALRATDAETTAALAADFLAHRAERRTATGLTAAQIELERQREWLEGLARYVELGIWREAATNPAYQPVAALATVDDFNQYAGYDRRWERELDQMGRMAGDPGETRFYYTGMAQAMLLDRLDPGWKAAAFEPEVFLEDQLAAALANGR